MINCKNIYKKYGVEEVLIDFSYDFPNTGFVLLYGESGCGKTTLLNILAGLIEFDKGKVIFGDETYYIRVNMDKASDHIGYITQDPHFIDYLTVIDNLKLCSTDDKEIETMLSRLGLSDKKNSYPQKLSGGEKQRVAIIQALLSGKSILLLDEPTASLDKENKILIFKTLENLKSSKLILCCSHDDEALAYADQIVDFNNLGNIQIPLSTVQTANSNPIDAKPNSDASKRKLQPFMNKLYTYPKREKKSRRLLIIVFIFAFFALCLCDTPQSKTESNIEYVYKLNQYYIISKNISENLLQRLSSDKHIVEVNLLYNRSVPDGRTTEEDENIKVTYNMTAKTIPFNGDAFRLSDRIAFGSYFTKAEQIILSFEMAESIGNPAALIGETLKVNMYDGSYNFEIAGVFNKFTEIERQYLSASGIDWTDGSKNVFFINGEFTKRYINDKGFFAHGDRFYTVYFDNFKNMKTSYESNIKNRTSDILVYARINNSISSLFTIMFSILLPFVLTVIPIALLLYYQTRKIEMLYNRHIFSVYQYLGYAVDEIKRSWVIGSLKEILRVVVIALVISIPAMIVLNMINLKMIFLPFQIFTANILMIIIMIALVSVLSIIISRKTLKKIKVTGWYSILLKHRDLI
ncbi:MAG: ATP-binding cassette domain-containing protein [Parabacteroides sp.]|nr:ATP-binding cassette domain-containing protein [Parabacteroides sp.]